MDDKVERDEKTTLNIKTMTGNLICNSCEQSALRATQETAAIQTQNEKLQRKLRAQEKDAEKKHLAAEQRIAQLTQQCLQAQAGPSNETLLQEFEELKAVHLTTQKQLTDKYQALILQSEDFKVTAEKTSLADTAITEVNKLKNDVERLTAINLQLEQHQNDDNRMDTDNGAEGPYNLDDHRQSYARFEALMAAQQQKLCEMIGQAIAPVRQIITEVVDRRLATFGHTIPVTTTASTSLVAQDEQPQQQALLKATDTTFAEALYTNSPKGKFSIVVPDDQQLIIDQIELDDDLTQCGRCQIIERRTPTSLAVTTDEATSVCICDKLKTKYPAAEVREADATPKYRIKVSGCKANLAIEDTEPTPAQMTLAEQHFKRYNDIPDEKLFKVEMMWNLKGKSIKYTNYVIEVDASVHKKLIREGRINEGFAQRRVSEYIDILQCKSCWRFGYLKLTCTFPPCCKICAGEHSSEECPAPETKPVCSKCVRHNSSSSKPISTSHSVAADNCPIRINRIKRLKIHFKAPQKKLINFRN